MNRRRWIAPPLAATLMLAASTGAWPDESEHDHDRARAALQAGEIVPLKEILERAEQDFAGGSLLEVELEREDGRWVYELKLLAPGGRVLELEYDARSQELLRAKGHDLGRGRRGRSKERND